MFQARTARRLSLRAFTPLGLLLLACETTALDVLERTSADGGGTTCAAAPAALAGFYKIRSNSSGKCLAVGAPIVVGNLPGRLTAMVDDCSNQGEIFQLIPDGGFGSFNLRASSTNQNIDIEMVQSDDGTRVILFASNGLGNQRFSFQMRRERVFALVPGNASSSCITEVQPQPEIFACKSDQANQEWELVPASCG